MNGNDTSTALLDLAQELIQKQGYNAFSYKDLSLKIGIKTSSIHYHYPTKADLVAGLVARYRRMFSEALQEIDQRGLGPKEKVKCLVDLFLKTTASGRMCVGGMLASDFQTLPTPVREEVKGFFSDTERWLEEVLREGEKLKVFSFRGSPKKKAEMFFSALEGCMMSSRMFGDDSRLLELKEWMVDVLTR